MTTVTERRNNRRTITFAYEQLNSKKHGVTFGNPSADSSPYQAMCLPINFFHTPGQYNKMLIKLTSNEKISNIDRQIGVLKSLEFINEPIFQKEKQKRDQRIKNYEAKKRQERSIKTSPRVSKCICCCCDDFCTDCAAQTICQKQEPVVEQSTSKLDDSSKKWFIDIQGMKNGEYKRKNVKVLDQHEIVTQNCHPKRDISSNRVEQLISKTLMEQIEQKRDKKLNDLIKKQRKQALRQFNQSIREKNRCSSEDNKLKSKCSVKPSKSQIREAYWQSIRELIVYELKHPRHKNKTEKKDKQQTQCHKRSPPKYDQATALKLQELRGKSAEKEIQQIKVQKIEKEKKKMKKLLALDSQQKEIMKKCRSKKFKPNEHMIETAFAHFV